MASKARLTAAVDKKPLSVVSKNETLWLVKVPAFVAENWAKKKNGDLLGSLSISTINVPNGPPTRVTNVSLTNVSGSEPDAFTLDEVAAGDHQHLAFKHHDASKAFSVQGKVTKHLSLRPKDTRKYREKIRERCIKATTRQETQKASYMEIAAEETVDAARSAGFIPPVTREDLYGSKGVKGAVSLDMSELRNKVYELFAKAERYTLKELQMSCRDVPGFSKEKELKEVLEEIGTYNAKGTNRGYWELKMEYKDHSAQR